MISLVDEMEILLILFLFISLHLEWKDLPFSLREEGFLSDLSPHPILSWTLWGL